MGTFSGKKFSNAHSSAIDAAVPLITHAARLPEVKKISLGFITVIKSNGTNIHRIKFVQEAACVKAVVRGGISMQELRFYTQEPENLLIILTNYQASLQKNS